MIFISSISKFDQIKNKDEGFIVITTQTRGFNIVHKVNCPYIMKKHFIKRMDSKVKPGDYIWFESINDVEKEFPDLRDCKQCNPLSKKLRFD
jgi:hypothetical protein